MAQNDTFDTRPGTMVRQTNKMRTPVHGSSRWRRKGHHVAHMADTFDTLPVRTATPARELRTPVHEPSHARRFAVFPSQSQRKGHGEREVVAEHESHRDESFHPSTGVRPYQILSLGLKHGEAVRARKEFDDGGTGGLHHAAIIREMEVERQSPRKYLHQSANIGGYEEPDYVWRWDGRPPEVIIGKDHTSTFGQDNMDEHRSMFNFEDGEDERKRGSGDFVRHKQNQNPDARRFRDGVGFGGSRTSTLFNRLLGDGTVYTAETRAGAEIYLIEKLLKNNQTNSTQGVHHDDQDESNELRQHLHRIRVNDAVQKRYGLRMEDLQENKEGRLGLGASIKNKFEFKHGEMRKFHQLWNGMTNVRQGQMMADAYVGVPKGRKETQYGLSSTNEEIIVGPVGPDRIDHIESVLIPDRKKLQQYLIKHHKIDVTKKNDFYQKLQGKIDNGREVTVETLLEDANIERAMNGDDDDDEEEFDN